MKIKVHILGADTGAEQPCGRIVDDLPCGASLSDLLARLKASSPEIFSESIVVLVNGQSIPVTIRDDYKLSEMDEITIFPPIAGG